MNLLNSLRYLVALHEHRHFERAAQACHITQPALSNALRALEREFGLPIVHRGRTYSGFTPEGEQVLATARRMLHEHELLQQTLAGRDGEPVGTLRLGVVPSALPVATRFLALLQQRHPGLKSVLLSMNSADLETGLKTLAIDLALGFTERVDARSSGLQVLAQYREHYYLVQRARRAARAEPVSWADAARLSLCLLTPDMHNRSIVDAAFARAGVTVLPAMETNATLTLALVVQGGEMATVMPGALVATLPTGRGLNVRPLRQPEVTTPVGFLLNRKATPGRVLQAALAFAKDPVWLAELARCSGALEGA